MSQIIVRVCVCVCVRAGYVCVFPVLVGNVGSEGELKIDILAADADLETSAQQISPLPTLVSNQPTACTIKASRGCSKRFMSVMES